MTKLCALCPNYLEYEIAVLKSNIAACHVKLAEWKAAIDAATQSLEALDRLEPAAQGQPDDANKDEPVELADDEEEEQTLAKLRGQRSKARGYTEDTHEGTLAPSQGAE